MKHLKLILSAAAVAMSVSLSACSGDNNNNEIQPEPSGKSSVSCPLKPSDSAPLKHSTMPP